MNRELTPPDVGPPSANYALAVVSTTPERWLHTSGIGPVRPDGSVPAELDHQAEVVWSTVLSLLDGAGLTPADVVSVSTYVVVGQELGPVMAARDRALGQHRCASVLIPVPGLASPEWLMEVAVIAAGSQPEPADR